MLFTRLNILLLSIIVICNACEDKDPTKPGYQRKPPAPEFYKFELGEAKSYLWAKPGSYWIYKQTVTGDLDTQIVRGFNFYTSQSKGTEDYSKHITIEYDMLSRTIYSSFNKWNFYESTGAATPNSAKYYKNHRTIIDRQGAASINVPFFHPFQINAWSGTGSSNTYCKQVDSVLEVQGKPYYNVAKFDIDMDGIWEKKLNCENPNSVYYWAKDVGLIKKDMNRCYYSWELIDYNIIK